MAYILVIVAPGGEEKRHSPAPTLRQIETTAAYVLMINEVRRGEARAFARRLVEQPASTPVLHAASRSVFRVEVTR